MRWTAVPIVLAVTLGAWACGGRAEAIRPAPVPDGGAARDQAIRSAGERIFDALVAGRPESLLADDLTLRSLVDAPAATRYSALRMGLGSRLAVRPEDFVTLEGARFGGVCLQGSRVERPGGALGLTREGWVFSRALVMGVKPGGRRMGAWVEGTFVFTGDRFVALDLSRVEIPRWEHADLDLAPCDMEVGVRDPL